MESAQPITTPLKNLEDTDAVIVEPVVIENHKCIPRDSAAKQSECKPCCPACDNKCEQNNCCKPCACSNDTIDCKYTYACGEGSCQCKTRNACEEDVTCAADNKLFADNFKNFFNKLFGIK
jgi:hypothetical protein